MANYRSVRLILQNSSAFSLIIEGFAAIRGKWDRDYSPIQNAEVPIQSTAEWISLSDTPGIGTAAFIRFSSSRGFIRAQWNMRWAGPFEFHIEPTDRAWELIHQIHDEYPDNIVVVVTAKHALPQANEEL